MQANSIKAVPALELHRVHDIDSPAARQMWRSARLVECDRFCTRCAVAQLEAEVAPIGAEGLGPNHLDLAAEQQRLTIADTEGRQQLNLMVKAWFEIGESRRCLDRDRSGEGAAIEAPRRVPVEALLELIEATRQHR